MPEEFIDIYDKNRERTGKTIPRANAHLSEGEYMLYVTGIIENADAKFLITQRSQNKSWGAGWWEVTGGGVCSGESPNETMVREVAEEVGLDASGVDLKPVYSYENVDLERGDNYFMDIYRIKLDFKPEDVRLQESEAVDFRLASWDEIVELNEQGVFLHFSRIEKALGSSL